MAGVRWDLLGSAESLADHDNSFERLLLGCCAVSFFYFLQRVERVGEGGGGGGVEGSARGVGVARDERERERERETERETERDRTRNKRRQPGRKKRGRELDR